MIEKNGYSIHETCIIETEKIGCGTKIWAFSHISHGVIIGKNCTIGERVYIGPHVTIGDNVKIQNNCLIYEGVDIEDRVFLGPSVVTTNDIYPRASKEWKHRFKKTLFKRGSSVGANSTIICGNIVGENSLVGAGSVVTKNIKSGTLVCGNPARYIRELDEK